MNTNRTHIFKAKEDAMRAAVQAWNEAMKPTTPLIYPVKWDLIPLIAGLARDAGHGQVASELEAAWNMQPE